MTLTQLATAGIAQMAINESVGSQLPGRENGPADAYRHILLAAELTRVLGEPYARAVLQYHEWEGENTEGWTPEAEAMDFYNNELGIDIANRLIMEDPNASWEDIVNDARELFDPSENNGNGARWLPEDQWKKNPEDEFKHRIPTDDPRINWPVDWKVGLYNNNYPILPMYRPYAFASEIVHDVNDLWHAFKNWVAPSRDPLVLDLDGDGIETLGVNATTHVVFDHDGDGLKTGTGWIAGDDGFVVLDRNGNGTIDNGGELFGDQTSVNGVKATDGFSALSGEDTDHDGTFDADDANYANVRVWQDKNQDGVSQTSELKTLTELGIASINLDSTASATTTNGNTQTATGTYTKTDGTTGTAGNLNFTSNAFYREFTDEIILTDTALALPDMQGSGMVRDLREASTLSAGLTSTLQSMSTTYETRDQMMAQIDTLLGQWAGTSSMATSVQQASDINGDILVYLPTQNSADFNLYMDMYYGPQTSGDGSSSVAVSIDLERYAYLRSEQARVTAMISVLERFNGETFVTIEPDKVTASSGTVTMRTTPSTTTGGSGGSSIVAPYAFVGLSATQVSFLDQSYAALKQSVYDALVLQTRLSGYMDAVDLTIDETGIHINDSAMMAMLTTLLQTDPANAMEDLLEINKYAGANFSALGWNGDERVLDVLAESDGLYDMTAVFAKYGMTIADGIYTGTAGNDDIWGKQRDDVIDAGEGNNRVHGGAGNDTVTAIYGHNIIHGGAGNDSITTGNGNDKVYGDAGDDILFSGVYGTDTLGGGTGNDILEGGEGDDTYLFNKGDGKDIVYDGWSRRGAAYNGSNAGNNDTISFGEGISASDVVAKIVGNNLILAIRESGKTFDQLSDTITIENWYNTANRIENIIFADGTKLSTVSAILSLAGSEWDDTIIGTEQGMTLDAKGGNDTVTAIYGHNIIHGGAGNDSITTGNGNDKVYGDAGDDILFSGVYGTDTLGGGTGNDILEGGEGDDTYLFNKGDGKDIVYDGWSRRGAAYNGSNAGNNDTISFGEGISASDVAFYFESSSLYVEYGFGDIITIEYQKYAANAIEKFTLSDGNYLTSSDVNLIIQSMNAYATDNGITIDSMDTVKNNQDLMNIVAAGWHQ